ncbi:hypothetical protein, partial [Clostridioides difficile]|uniref:hypothetical protein n=1 Tax=Clostridioides difficile TaxID=1496 RepID=UPI001CA58269
AKSFTKVTYSSISFLSSYIISSLFNLSLLNLHTPSSAIRLLLIVNIVSRDTPKLLLRSS